MKLNCKMQIMDLEGSPMAIPVGSMDFCGVLRVNGVTADILKLLETEQNMASMVTALKKEYDATEEQLLHSVEKVISVLKENNLLCGQ